MAASYETDMWSFGCCVFRILTGVDLFSLEGRLVHDKNDEQLFRMIEVC